MSILRAEELINTAIVHIRLLENLFCESVNRPMCCDRVQDALTSLLDAKEELKDYKL